ncbi:MAG: hypothetical protein ABH950_06135 [Candidatus Altiarchaeota archaeon]
MLPATKIAEAVGEKVVGSVKRVGKVPIGFGNTMELSDKEVAVLVHPESNDGGRKPFAVLVLHEFEDGLSIKFLNLQNPRLEFTGQVAPTYLQELIDELIHQKNSLAKRARDVYKSAAVIRKKNLTSNRDRKVPILRLLRKGGSDAVDLHRSRVKEFLRKKEEAGWVGDDLLDHVAEFTRGLADDMVRDFPERFKGGIGHMAQEHPGLPKEVHTDTRNRFYEFAMQRGYGFVICAAIGAHQYDYFKGRYGFKPKRSNPYVAQAIIRMLKAKATAIQNEGRPGDLFLGTPTERISHTYQQLLTEDHNAIIKRGGAGARDEISQQALIIMQRKLK